MNQFPHCHLIPTRKAITYLPCQTIGIHFTKGFLGKFDCRLGGRMAVFDPCHASCAVLYYDNFSNIGYEQFEFELPLETGSFRCHASVSTSRWTAGQRICYHLFIWFLQAFISHFAQKVSPLHHLQIFSGIDITFSQHIPTVHVTHMLFAMWH